MGSDARLEWSCRHIVHLLPSEGVPRPFRNSCAELAILGIVPVVSPFCRSGYLVGDREVTWTRSSSEAPRLSH